MFKLFTFFKRKPVEPPPKPLAVVYLAGEAAKEAFRLLDAYYASPGRQDHTATFAFWSYLEAVTGYDYRHNMDYKRGCTVLEITIWPPKTVWETRHVISSRPSA